MSAGQPRPGVLAGPPVDVISVAGQVAREEFLGVPTKLVMSEAVAIEAGDGIRDRGEAAGEATLPHRGDAGDPAARSRSAGQGRNIGQRQRSVGRRGQAHEIVRKVMRILQGPGELLDRELMPLPGDGGRG